jgi:hypothetical protein
VVVLLQHQPEEIDVEKHTAIVGGGSSPEQVVAVAEYMLALDEGSTRTWSKTDL